MTESTARSPVLRPVMLVPLAALVDLAAVLAAGLTLNPREIPSPLIGKPVPRFELPPVRGRTLGLTWAIRTRAPAPISTAGWRSGRSRPELLDETLRPLIARLRQ